MRNAITIMASLAILICASSLAAEAGDIKQGLHKADNGAKKGVSVPVNGVKKGYRTSVNGTKKGWHSTTHFVKKVF
jgi:hypothetical protein